MILSKYLKKSCITLNLTGINKREIITNLVTTISKHYSISTAEHIVNDLIEREKLKTTGIGFGIAIPHCRNPEVNKIHIAIGISRKGLNFNALDEKPVRIFFLIVGSTNSCTGHISLVAKIARLVKNPDVRQALLEKKSPKDVIDYIKDMETVLISDRS